jgi:phenylpropionate dioxygenase-like ring-hydroxylating dioxygenase large terminal subunit
LDQDIVVFRDQSGSPHALLDRCAHRGVRLSKGRVVKGTLECRYHGWQFDGRGHCVNIPSLASGRAIKPGTAVEGFPCLDQDGYIWVWIGAGPPNPSRPSRIRSFERAHWTQGSTTARHSSLRGIENNLDWCHASFTHPWTHPHFFKAKLMGLREQQYETRVTDSGMVVFAGVTEHAEQPIPDNALKIFFDLPDRITFELPRGRTMVVLHFVPTGPSTCRIEWLVRRLLSIGPRVRWRAREHRVFSEDREILESAQEAYDRYGEGFERSVEADAATLLARRVWELAAAGRWSDDRGTLPQRRVVTVRA